MGKPFSRVVIDTDPGIDDLFAILMALGSPSLRVDAILSTCGNVGVDRTTENVLRILALADRADVPVCRGAELPMSGSLRDASHVHGADGLGGIELPAAASKAPEAARDFLLDTWSEVPLTLIPLDTTLRTRVTAARGAAIRQIPRIGVVLADALPRYTEYAALHDPNTVAWLLDRKLYRCERGMVTVSDGGHTEFRQGAGGPHEVAFDVDADGFFRLLLNALEGSASTVSRRGGSPS